MAGVGVVILAEDAVDCGIVIVRGSEICGNEESVLRADRINNGAKDVRRPKIVDRAEEKNDAFRAGWVEGFEKAREFGTVREFANERSGLKATQPCGRGLFGGENHLKAHISGSINNRAARVANQLEAARVFSAVNAGEADNVNNVAATGFERTAEGSVVKAGDGGIDLCGRNGAMQIDPAESLA